MAVWKDSLGNEWVVDVTVLSAKWLRERCNPAIRITEPESLAALFDDESSQYEAMWVLCADQAKERNIDAQQFAKLFTESYKNAAEALVKSLENFFLSIGRRELLSVISTTLGALTKLRSVAERNVSSASTAQAIEALVARVDKEVQAEIQKIIGPKSGELQVAAE